MLFEISLAILILVLGLQIIRRFGGLFGICSRSGFTRIFKKIEADSRGYFYIFIISIFIIFGMLFYQSYQQYQVWSQNEPSKFLLPPYQTLNYFVFYVFMRFFVPYLISLIAAFLFFFAAKILNKKYEERFFEPEEFWLGVLAIFLMGHPGWIFYAVIFILVYLIIHILGFCRSGFTRLSMYYLWIPIGIFVMIISKYLQSLPIWQLLKI